MDDNVNQYNPRKTSEMDSSFKATMWELVHEHRVLSLLIFLIIVTVIISTVLAIISANTNQFDTDLKPATPTIERPLLEAEVQSEQDLAPAIHKLETLDLNQLDEDLEALDAFLE